MEKNVKKVKFNKKIIITFLILILVLSTSIYVYSRYKNYKAEMDKKMPYNFETLEIKEPTDFTDILTNYSKTLSEVSLYKELDSVKTGAKVESGKYLKTYGNKDGFSKVKYEDSFYYVKTSELENVSKDDDFKVIKGVLLVNTKYKLPSDFNPGFDKFVSEQINLMKVDANREKIELNIHKDFISYDEQKTLRKNAPKIEGDLIYSLYANAGHSESQIGESFDVIGKDESKNLNENFKETEEFLWLKKNAHKYGFILRYPENREDITNFKFAPWHFRYVGVENAKIINEKNITLEEFLRMK